MNVKVCMEDIAYPGRNVQVGCTPMAVVLHRFDCRSLQWRHNERDGVSVTSLTIVYSNVYSGTDQRKHQSSPSLAFVWGIHRWPLNFPTKGMYRGKCFHLMTSSCIPLPTCWTADNKYDTWIISCYVNVALQLWTPWKRDKMASQSMRHKPCWNIHVNWCWL